MSDIRKRVGKKGTTYQVRFPAENSKSGYAYQTFNTLKEARAFRENAARRHSSRPADRTLSVESGLQIWLEVCEKEGRGGRAPVTGYTLKTYRYRAEIIKAYNWPRPLNELSAPDVVEFRSWLLRNHSRDQAKKTLSYFHSMVLELINRGLLTNDFAAGVRVANVTRYDEPITIPTEAEIRALLRAADDLANSKNARIAKTWARYRPMLYLAVDSGMRPQEYLVLGRSNITKRGVQVDRALDAGGKEISVTKTRSGRRFIDLSPGTVDMITHYAHNCAHKNPHDLVFPTGNGNWQSSNNWRRRGFLVACEKAGLIDEEAVEGTTAFIPRFRPYDLRHFYASMLIEKKINIKRIQRLMGHSDIQTTLNIYGHVIERIEWEQTEETHLISSLSTNASCGGSVADEPQAPVSPSF